MENKQYTLNMGELALIMGTEGLALNVGTSILALNLVTVGLALNEMPRCPKIRIEQGGIQWNWH